MSTQPFVPDPYEIRQITPQGYTPEIQDIIAQLTAPPNNLQLLPSADDPFLGQHDELDHEIRDSGASMSHVYLRRSVALQTCSMSRQKWQGIESKYPLIILLLKKIWETPGASFSVFRRLSIFHQDKSQPCAPDVAGPGGLHAIESSWTAQYQGNAANALHETLEKYLKPGGPGQDWACCVPIIQSSGTGKSRMVDELGKKIICIPLNLSSQWSTYPPPDDETFIQWFKGAADDCIDKLQLQHHYESFLFGLLEVTRNRLELILQNCGRTSSEPVDSHSSKQQHLDRLSKIATIFRSHMTRTLPIEDTSMKPWKYDQYRQGFFKEVMSCAQGFRASALSPPNNARSLRGRLVRKGIDGDETVATAAERLQTLLDPLHLCKSDLLLAISFDESHSLTDEIMNEIGNKVLPWTRFSVLRHVLRFMGSQPFFAFFLSTSGKFNNFAPSPEDDTSVRPYRHMLIPFHPITAVSFDDFALRVVPDGSFTLTGLASTRHIVHLGRALFASRYSFDDEKVVASIIDFAGGTSV